MLCTVRHSRSAAVSVRGVRDGQGAGFGQGSQGTRVLTGSRATDAVHELQGLRDELDLNAAAGPQLGVPGASGRQVAQQAPAHRGGVGQGPRRVARGGQGLGDGGLHPGAHGRAAGDDAGAGQRHALPRPGVPGVILPESRPADTATGPLLPDGRSRMSTSYSGPFRPGAVSAATIGVRRPDEPLAGRHWAPPRPGAFRHAGRMV